MDAINAAVLARLVGRLEGRVLTITELLDDGTFAGVDRSWPIARRATLNDVLDEIASLRTEVTDQFSKRVDL